MRDDATGPLEVFFQDMPPSPAVETYAAERYQKLMRHHARVGPGRLTIGKASHGHSKGSIFEVTLTLEAPGLEPIVDHTRSAGGTAKDLHVAIRDAFKAADRKLVDGAKRLGGGGQRHRHARTNKSTPGV